MAKNNLHGLKHIKGSKQLASALSKRGIGKGDTVAVLCFNTPEIYETHFGVPMIGAVLNTINIRLDVDTISYILEHGEAKALITDNELSPTIKQVLDKIKNKILVIDIDDELANHPEELERILEKLIMRIFF